jgi:hypothetical protein
MKIRKLQAVISFIIPAPGKDLIIPNIYLDSLSKPLMLEGVVLDWSAFLAHPLWQ